jgi:small ligand-binding sensory domain FIST
VDDYGGATVKWASSISTLPSLDQAVEEATAALRTQLGDTPDLIVAFVSPIYSASSTLSERLRQVFPGARVIGCTAGGVAGGGREVEQDVGLSLTAAVLPDVGVEICHLSGEQLPEEDDDPEVWRALIGLEPEHQPSFLLLPDPFSFDTGALLAGLDRAYPSAPKVGGLASGGRRPGEHSLFVDDMVHNSGCVCVALYGDVRMDTVVAQGCRPIGIPFTVTRGHQNLIYELNNQKVLTTLEILFNKLTPREQALFRRSPMLGLAIDSTKKPLRQGDFLVRAVQGVSRQSGALALSGEVERGQVVQFHVRDAASSAHDLNELLDRHQRQHPEPLAGALMFNCLGRGKLFYGQEDHDTKAFGELMGAAPLGGFFCSGEIGPVHAQTFLHGYTCALALFRPRGWS